MSEVTRKLASVRRISEIRPIEGADNIVCAVVDGWELVTQKSNNFKPDDLVVYFEVDSFLPAIEKFEFLRKSSLKVLDGVEGFRLKTIKLRGQISQGLILPLSEFADHGQMEEGDDLTELLGVKKFEKPLSPALSGKARGNFPEWLVKTDQERIQNVFKYRHRHLGEKYEASLKLDGSSMTVYYKDGYVGVCSRNLDLIEDETNLFWKVARSTKIIEALEKFGMNCAIQGELMGPGVQGNREQFKEHKFFVFDVYNIEEMDYLEPEGRHLLLSFLREQLGTTVDHVPVIGTINMDDFDTVQKFLDYADEQKSINHPIAEGVVFKSYGPRRNSFKAISNKFLLKE